MDKLRVIITGATGMVGEGVLHECLQHSHVEKVLVIGRSTCGYSHPKLTEILHADFFDFTSIEDQLSGYNACYFCLGVTSVGKNEADYTKFTYTLTIGFATILAKLNPEMTFCYISGAGTGMEKRQMWARVKGKTENDLMQLGFKAVYNFRPAGIKPFLPLKPSQTYYKSYKYFGWLLPVVKLFFPNAIITLKTFAAAMINSSLVHNSKSILEVKDIKRMAKERQNEASI